jgi:hypothetical protein
MNERVNHIILGGGGVKGIGLIGALFALFKGATEDMETLHLDALRDVKAPHDVLLSGASIGSVVSFMLSLDYSLGDIAHMLMRIPPESLMPFKMELMPFSACSNENMLKITRRLLEHRRIDPDITYKDFPAKHRLGIFIYCISQAQVIYVGPETIGTDLSEWKLVDLLLASTAIPSVLPPIIRDANIYVDGFSTNLFPFFVGHHFPDALYLNLADESKCLEWTVENMPHNMIECFAVRAQHPLLKQIFPAMKLINIQTGDVHCLEKLSPEHQSQLFRNGIDAIKGHAKGAC